MPVKIAYPGVYIEELPSGQHTISGVSTSTTAFVGRAPKGPIDEVLTLFNFGDFERYYGGLSYDYPMGYAVRDYFLNGGSQAVIARAFKSVEGSGVATLRLPNPPPPLAENWQVSGDATKGTYKITVVGGENEAEVGDIFTISGDSTKYTVNSFELGSGGDSAEIDFSPALTLVPCPCAVIKFHRGPEPAAWVVAADASDSPMTIESGNGAPQIGDTFTVSNGTTVYTVLGYAPQLGGSDTPASLTFTPTPENAITKGSKLTFSELPSPPAAPTGWKVKTAVQKGDDNKTVAITGGSGEPQPGDTFTVGSGATSYTVTSYDSGTNAVGFEGSDGNGAQNAFPACSDLSFSRSSPAGWYVDTAPALPNLNQATISGQSSDSEGSGTIEPGMLFRVGAASQAYEVRYYDAASKTIYFIPEAEAESFTSKSPLSFIPSLTLQAANPGVWGNSLQATVNTSGITAAVAKNFAQYNLTQEDLFNLSIIYTNSKGQTTSEQFRNVSVKNTNSPNRLDRLLAAQSQLVRVHTNLETNSLIAPANGAMASGQGGNDGTYLDALALIGDQNLKTGIYLLDRTNLFNILCIPPDRREGDQFAEVYTSAVQYCSERRAMLIVDPPQSWAEKARSGQIGEIDPADPELGIEGELAENAAVYFPRVLEQDLEMNGQTYVFPACGIIAGVWASTDVSRGVWKAPAGQDAALLGITGLEVNLTDQQNGTLNPLGINCLRTFPVIGSVVWGARTLRGADQLESDYKYVPVRRLTQYIEDSLFQGTKWAVFEPNNEALWSALRLSVGGFMAQLSREGAFYDYKVVCDSSTTTQQDIDLGIVNVLVAFAPVKPAEFVVIQIQQQAGKS